MPPTQSIDQLLVEGKNDQHVIWALCEKHNIPELFTVETPPDAGGVEQLLDSVPVRLKIAGLRALGIVLDADLDIDAQWDRIRHRLDVAGYRMIPKEPAAMGTLIRSAGKPVIGVWIMPNNQLPGMLEDFVARLIPAEDTLADKATAVLDDIEAHRLNKYASVHRPKAFVHTWLAWQKTPGQSMGQAITANVLSGDGELAQSFVTWLNQLFIEPRQHP